MLKIENEIPINIEAGENPFLRGVFGPIGREITADTLEVIGEIPDDLFGVYLRNGPNPIFQPRGRYHWFDGDGMIHAIHFEGGKASYRNRWIRTDGFRTEREAGHAVWPGLMDRPDPSAPKGAGSDGWLKDTANTDVVFHNGYALALWYQCGLPYKVDARTLETLGVETFRGGLKRTVSAHAKVDPATNELLFFDYSTAAPFMTYNVVSAAGELAHHAPIEIPGPRLPHDMAFTERYSVLMDLPLFWDPELLQRGVHKVTYYPEMPSRFGILPRFGTNRDVRWFEASPCYIYHVINSWEEKDASGNEVIVMDACRVIQPEPGAKRGEGELARMRAFLRLEAQVCRWRFNLGTGEVAEEQLDDARTEWPTINRSRMGRRSRYAYNSLVPHFEGIVKYDLERNSTEKYLFGAGRTANECPFAPRPGARDEDDGYVVAFVSDINAKDSGEVVILDAKNIAKGPLARVKIPQRVPVGFHTIWVPGDQLGA
ncbi:MAG TPA: carotenoid oxygenase family protein [Candidatus Binataceae bacterium]|nr:carotenoid oxygenase family protein [Candidatus Binataceae bacterium]